jgi:mannose-6-phosphate isomerase class I
MNRKMHIVAAIATFALAAGFARAETSATASPTHAQVEELLRSAHTVEQYQMLASYFHARQLAFEQQAQSEKLEWERRSQNITGPAAKYPRPVDSSRNRYEYFTYEAQHMGQQAAHYDNLSASAQ